MERIIPWWPQDITRSTLRRAGYPEATSQDPGLAADPSVVTPTSARCASDGTSNTEEVLNGSGDDVSDTDSDSCDLRPEKNESDNETSESETGNNEGETSDNDDDGDSGGNCDSDSESHSPVQNHGISFGGEIPPSPPLTSESSRHRLRSNSITGKFVLDDNDPSVLAKLPVVEVDMGGAIVPIEDDDNARVLSTSRKRLAIEPTPGDSGPSSESTRPAAPIATSHAPPAGAFDSNRATSDRLTLSRPLLPLETSLPVSVTYDGQDCLEIDLIPAGGGILEEFENGIADTSVKKHMHV